MTDRIRLLGRLAGVLVCAFTLAASSPGCGTSATETASRRMMALDRKALQAYEAGELLRAKKLLVEAVSIGRKNGLTDHETMARTYLDLGAVYLAMEDRDRSIRTLGLALRIQPDIEPIAEIATPPLKRAMATARQRIKRTAGAQAVARKEPEPAAEPRPERPVERKARPPEPEPEPEAKPEPPPKVAARPKRRSSNVEEPDLPATIPQPLFCAAPEEIPPESEIPMRCVAQPQIAFGRMMLFYRPAGSETFTPVPMVRSRKGWYQGLVPAAATAGKSLQYYVEAQGPSNRVATSNGQADSPNLVLIREGAPPAREGALAAAHLERSEPEAKVSSDDEDPIAESEKEREREALEATRERRGRYFVGAGIGTGLGWHGRRVLEFRTEDAVEPGVSPAGLLHLTPEVGMLLGESWALSLQSRHQFIPEQGAGDGKPGAPHHSAHAVFARVYYFFGEDPLQFFFTLTAGGGEGFRLVIPPNTAAGVARNDTVRGGPWVAGPSFGVKYHLTDHIGVLGEGRVLYGFPDQAGVVELSTSGQITF
jgi:tetratricopeptide (TPR) repeat protein